MALVHGLSQQRALQWCGAFLFQRSIIINLSQGLDVRGIYAVIQYGLTRDMPSLLQRGGRCGRDSNLDAAVFLTLYEPWVLDIVATRPDSHPHGSDPDAPVSTISKDSSKRERTGMAVIQHFQSTDCH